MKANDKKIIFFPVPISELKIILEDIIRNEIKMIIPQPKVESELITRKEASKILRISLVSLDKFIRSGDIPAYRMRSKVRLKKHEVMKCLSEIKTFKHSRSTYL